MGIGVLELMIVASVVVAFLFALNYKRRGMLVALGVLVALPALAGIAWLVAGQRVTRSVEQRSTTTVIGTLDGAEFVVPEYRRSAISSNSGFALGSLMVVMLGALALVGLVMAIKHRRWGLLAGSCLLIAAPISLLVLGSLAELQKDFGGMPSLAPLSSAEPTTALATAAQPQIVLDDPAGVTAEYQPDDLPEWVTAKQPAGRVILVSDPSTTASGARKKATEKLAAWVDAEVRDAHGESAVGLIRTALWPGDFERYYERFGRAQHLGVAETSVGRVFLIHVAAEMNEADQQWVADTVAKATREKSRAQRVQTVAFGGAGVLGLVAMAHFFLRMGPAVTPVVKEGAA